MSKISNLHEMNIIEEEKYALQKIQKSAAGFLCEKEKPVMVLEAGCGSCSHIEIKSKAYFIGIDISLEQLERNSNLNEKIHGDIQSYNLPKRTYDIIICWDVLEHLPNPDKALSNFSAAIKDEGIIILTMPNVLSFEGVVTKLTPHWFHIWVYRNIFHEKWAGTEGRGPFKAFLRKHSTDI